VIEVKNRHILPLFTTLSPFLPPLLKKHSLLTVLITSQLRGFLRMFGGKYGFTKASKAVI
jgi:hypothetical protein